MEVKMRNAAALRNPVKHGT